MNPWIIIGCLIAAIGMPASSASENQRHFSSVKHHIEGMNPEMAPASFDESHWDWRDFGVVPPAKDQGYCGSGWAFTIIGTLESHIALNFDEFLDLSEQQLISCDDNAFGCCGGDEWSFWTFHWNQPIPEICFPYGDTMTDCESDYSQIPCDYSCPEIPYNVNNVYSLDTSKPIQIAIDLMTGGPAYLSFDFYSDFWDYWYGSIGTYPWIENGVYFQDYGYLEGTHAVLVIGFNTQTGYWICRNSFGETEGPFGDGTFRLAWPDPYWHHTQNLNLNHANADIDPEDSCDMTGTTIWMPSDRYKPGDRFAWNILICNATSKDIVGHPLFAVLDVMGIYFFAPSFTAYDYYLFEFPPGKSVVEVLDDFPWPDGTGSGDARLYAVMTDPDVTEVYGEMDAFYFQWSDGSFTPTPTQTPFGYPTLTPSATPATFPRTPTLTPSATPATFPAMGFKKEIHVNAHPVQIPGAVDTPPPPHL